MTYVLIGLVVMLALLIVGLVWAWILAVPKTERYRSYEVLSNEQSGRNRAWDAAVLRARNRAHPSH